MKRINLKIIILGVFSVGCSSPKQGGNSEARSSSEGRGSNIEYKIDYAHVDDSTLDLLKSLEDDWMCSKKSETCTYESDDDALILKVVDEDACDELDDGVVGTKFIEDSKLCVLEISTSKSSNAKKKEKDEEEEEESDDHDKSDDEGTNLTSDDSDDEKGDDEKDDDEKDDDEKDDDEKDDDEKDDDEKDEDDKDDDDENDKKSSSNRGFRVAIQDVLDNDFDAAAFILFPQKDPSKTTGEKFSSKMRKGGFFTGLDSMLESETVEDHDGELFYLILMNSERCILTSDAIPIDTKHKAVTIIGVWSSLEPACEQDSGGSGGGTQQGNDSTSGGDGSTSSGDGSTSSGDGSTSSGDGSTSSGDGSTSSGDGSTASGDGSTASGDDNSTASGDDESNSGENSGS